MDFLSSGVKGLKKRTWEKNLMDYVAQKWWKGGGRGGEGREGER